MQSESFAMFFLKTQKIDESKCWKNMQEIIKTLHVVTETLPDNAQSLIAKYYGIEVDCGGDVTPSSNTNEPIHMQKVLEMLRHHSKAQQLRRLLDKVQLAA